MNLAKVQFVFLCACLLVPSVSADQGDADASFKLLAGTWQVSSIDAGGKKIDPGKGAPDKAIFKDGKVTFFSDGKEIPTFKDLRAQVDAAKKPKALDLVRNEKETLPCIFEIDKDELKLAMPLVPSDKKPENLLPRPESFDTAGSPVLVFNAKCAKNDK